MTTKHVDLYERSSQCWVASGDCEQWAATYEAIQAHIESLFARMRNNPYDFDLFVSHELDRASRLEKEFWDNIWKADQWGRLSTELFTSEADIIRRAIDADKPIVIIPAGTIAELITGKSVLVDQNILAS